MSVILYTKPQCPQCDATKRSLAKHGIAYELVDVTAGPAARDAVVALGYSQAPVVVAGDRHWSGFRPDRIREISNEAISASDATEVSA